MFNFYLWFSCEFCQDVSYNTVCLQSARWFSFVQPWFKVQHFRPSSIQFYSCRYDCAVDSLSTMMVRVRQKCWFLAVVALREFWKCCWQAVYWQTSLLILSNQLSRWLRYHGGPTAEVPKVPNNKSERVLWLGVAATTGFFISFMSTDYSEILARQSLSLH